MRIHRCEERGRTKSTYAMHVKDRYANGTLIDNIKKWHQ